MAKVIYEGYTSETVSFNEMPMGAIGVIVSELYEGVLVMKCDDGHKGVVVSLDGRHVWSTIGSNGLKVHVLGKDESVELTNE